MVMHKVRANSYLRRTISEPFTGRRLSVVISHAPESMAPALQMLLNRDPSIGPIFENEKPKYTWRTDVHGLQSILHT